jgi:hypothetical protein
MTPRAVLPVVLLLIALAGCDEDSSGPSTTSADQPGEAPAQTTSTAAPDPAACEKVSKKLEGLTLSEAKQRAERAGCPLRVVARDGEDLPVTQDFLEARINVKVEDDRVTSVDGLY